MFGFVKKVFGTKNDRELRRIGPIVSRINEIEPQFKALSDEQLKNKTAEFKARLAQGAPIDTLLVEAFAAVREAGRRTLGKRLFDVQLIGGIVLHEGKIAEMKTGEGKTLTATSPCYLNALTGKGVHVVTVNEYLASTQSEEMSKLYGALGMDVGCILNEMSDEERKEAYGKDITYGTNNEFGFDYLRDNMKVRLEDFVQRVPHFAIVDEVDSILIDEARTPLIISGPSDQTSERYLIADEAIRGLRKEIDYTVDEKSRSVALTEVGIRKAESRLNIENLYHPEHLELVHLVNNALKAHHAFRKDDHYIIKDGQVLIVDEFTGRLMHGRRYSEGLHQALEAKERVTVQRENQTLATVTLQNYFRMYEKLSGMTGTADTEAVELHKIYGLEVVVIPTNMPMVRKDHDDVLFFRQLDKFHKVVEQIETAHKKGQPVLVGTVSIEKSELLSDLLNKKSIPHEVLNAKNHKREAEIIANAGQKGNVTISTNMAGRGTDILLGAGVPDAGGLMVIGTERHESRRIDNQLRGRSGRQGDPGESIFFLSWEDDLLRRFNTKANNFILEKTMGSEAIVSPLMTRTIGQTQKRVEGFNYDIRKHLLEYDDVLNKQRKTVYAARMKILKQEDIKDVLLLEGLPALSKAFADEYEPPSGLPGEMVTMDYSKLERFLFSKLLSVVIFSPEERAKPELTRADLYAFLENKLKSLYIYKENLFGAQQLREIERWMMLQTIDHEWKDHLAGLDHLRDGIGLRGYGQKDPLQEYKKEAFAMFQLMVARVKQDSLEKIFRVQPNLSEHFAEDLERVNLKRAEQERKAARAKHDDNNQMLGRTEPSQISP